MPGGDSDLICSRRSVYTYKQVACNKTLIAVAQKQRNVVHFRPPGMDSLCCRENEAPFPGVLSPGLLGKQACWFSCSLYILIC